MVAQSKLESYRERAGKAAAKMPVLSLSPTLHTDTIFPGSGTTLCMASALWDALVPPCQLSLTPLSQAGALQRNLLVWSYWALRDMRVH